MKTLLGIIGIVFSLILFSYPVAAQGTQTFQDTSIDRFAPLPPDQLPPKFFGQTHFYSVLFRGNGEAVVDARITFTEKNAAERKTLQLRVPNVIPEDIYAFQVLQQNPCYDIRLDASVAENAMMPCPAYGGPDGVSGFGQTKYQRAEVARVGDTLTVSLATPVKKNTSGSIIVYYRAFGYAEKNLAGAYDFSFETLRVDEPIQSVQVGVTTDSDLMLRDAKGAVNYRYTESAPLMKEMAGSAAPVADSRMDMYTQQIGYGQLTKSASNLSASESYTVKGRYADSNIRLYAGEIGIGVLIVAIIVFLLGLLIRYLMRSSVRLSSNPTPGSKEAEAIVAVLGLSFLSAVLMAGYTILLIFLTRNLPTYVGYDMQLPITLVLLVLSMGVYGLLFIAPSLFTGLRYGLGAGLGTTGLTIAWLMVALILFILLGSRSSAVYSTPAPLMDIMKRGGGIAPMGVERDTTVSEPAQEQGIPTR